MALRERLQPVLETIQEFELAAEERYWSGLDLMTRGDASTGIYVIGYAAEMLLKNSYFLLDPLTTPTFPVGSQLGLAKQAMKNLVPLYPFGNYHDLIFWATLVIEKRREKDCGLLENLEVALRLQVENVSKNWFVELRYRAAQATPNEIHEVYEGVSWIRSHYRDGTLYSPRR